MVFLTSHPSDPPRPLLALRVLLLLCLNTLMVGCGGHRNEPSIAATGITTAPVVEFLVATNRLPDRGDAAGFGANRSPQLSFAHFSINVPPSHKPGQAELPLGKADQNRSFTVAAREDLPRESFLNRVATGPGRHDVFIYVHGYNTSFPRALYRQAQLVADARQTGTAILFAWPSQGALADYTGDRDAANFSRDHLAALLTDLSQDRRIGRITILGHSMGGWLTAETLRQLALTGRRDVLARLSVILAAPDIDVDVFAMQAATIGPMDPPLTILVATDDKALRFSGWMSGGRTRMGELDVGSPHAQAIAKRYGIALIDIGALDDPGMANHSRYAMAAALDPQIEGYDGTGIQEVGAFTLRKIGDAVASPFVLIAGAIAPQ